MPVNKFNHNDQHKRGEIEARKNLANNPYYRVYTGCKHFDDFYACDTLEHAEQMSKALQANTIYPEQYKRGEMDGYSEAIGDVKGAIDNIIETQSDDWDKHETNKPLELIDDAINELFKDRLFKSIRDK